MLAARVKAERVFFLNDDPVLVFTSLPAESDERDVLHCYRRAWSLARPRYLFLAVGDELRVYSLASLPTTPGVSRRPLTPLEVVTRAADVAEQLSRFHRSRLESGVTFEHPQMGNQTGRADQQLLRDVRSATTALVSAGLTRRLSHTLIERAILVRYLEDRTILTDAYFDEVASKLPEPLNRVGVNEAPVDFGPTSNFIRFLASKELTYALFDQLAGHFNRDLFIAENDEREAVTEEQLCLLQSLLKGDISANQERLFLWAYDFSVVPTDLVSNMYELFHHEEVTKKLADAYYTPPELVGSVIADVLDDNTLEQEPTVCDPACGSGIFLVEAYRRIVRHEMLKLERPLTRGRLQELLLQRIAGCDIDEGAIRLAAFSLYIAFLNYQQPNDILKAGPLPRLIHQRGEQGRNMAPLVVGDAFSPRQGEHTSNNEHYTGQQDGLPWTTEGFGVVVGNPPWSELKGGKSKAEQWASRLNRTIGDRSPSQLFLWRALDLLATGGVAALLISAKALLNTRPTSRRFREQWLGEAKLEHVVNFSHVRRDFFKTGVAPFMLVRFRRALDQRSGMVVYETARPVPRGRRGSSALARMDRQMVVQTSLRTRDYLWKTYTAGSPRDDAFLARLAVEDQLRDWTESKKLCGYGFQRGDDSTGHSPSMTLRDLRSLVKFDSWGALKDEWFESVPSRVKFVPDERLFRGQRLLIRRGVSPGFGPHARLETEPFAFRHTTYGISLTHLQPWQAEIILGTLVSSLGRYWLYMVSGSWGTWADEVRSGDLLELPTRMPAVWDVTTRKIRTAVGDLRDMNTLGDQVARHGIAAHMAHVDEAVADLFELTDSERSLVADFWVSQSTDATQSVAHIAAVRGTEADLDPHSKEGLDPYLIVFLRAWNQRLRAIGELSWRIWREPVEGVVAVVFETLGGEGNRFPFPNKEGDEGWWSALNRLGVEWNRTQAQSMLRYGTVRAVTDTSIIIVKRDERRLWSASAAWQDADATAAQLMSARRL